MLKSVGLFKASGHEALRGCITIPLFDDNGKVTGIIGRRIDRSVKADDITIGEGMMRPAGQIHRDAVGDRRPSRRDGGPGAATRPLHHLCRPGKSDPPNLGIA